MPIGSFKQYVLVVLGFMGVSCLKNDFGDDYAWADSLESGLAKAQSSSMPVMLIIHKSWCGACQNLKPKFAGSKEIQDLSRHFQMVNVMDDDEPKDSKYAPDGAYIPRILFIAPDGKVLNEFYNELGSDEYKYFYSQPDEIILTMRRVLKSHKKRVEGGSSEL